MFSLQLTVCDVLVDLHEHIQYVILAVSYRPNITPHSSHVIVTTNTLDSGHSTLSSLTGQSNYLLTFMLSPKLC